MDGTWLQHKRKLERQERMEHEDSMRATNDRTQRKRDGKIAKDKKLDEEKIEKELMEIMEKLTEDVNSNLLMDEVISNVERSKEQTECQEKNVMEVETISEEGESKEVSEDNETSIEEEDAGPKTCGKTEGSALKLVVGKNLMKELMKEAKELV